MEQYGLHACLEFAIYTGVSGSGKWIM